MSQTINLFVIPDRFTFDEDTSLKVFLRENATKPVAISFKNLRRIDSLLVQYLLSASKTWRNAGHDFCLTDVPSSLGDALCLLGVNEQILRWKVAV